MGKDGHLPTVLGLHCNFFFKFWWHLSALKEEKGEEEKRKGKTENLVYVRKGAFSEMDNEAGVNLAPI